MRRWLASGGLFLGVLTATPARAEVGDEPAPEAAEVDATAAVATANLVGALSARPSGRADVVAGGGWDGAARQSIVTARARIAIAGPLSGWASVARSDETGAMRPAAGVVVAVLRQGAAPIDLAFGGAYKAEGFTEPEGEAEATVAVGRRLGAVYALGNLVYGQDLEGRERDGEVAAALVLPLGALALSAEGAARYGALKDGSRRTAGELGIGVAIPLVGRYALRVLGGVGVVDQATRSYGPRGVVGVGAWF
jgi:hypothetical protein